MPNELSIGFPTEQLIVLEAIRISRFREPADRNRIDRVVCLVIGEIDFRQLAQIRLMVEPAAELCLAES